MIVEPITIYSMFNSIGLASIDYDPADGGLNEGFTLLGNVWNTSDSRFLYKDCRVSFRSDSAKDLSHWIKAGLIEVKGSEEEIFGVLFVRKDVEPEINKEHGYVLSPSLRFNIYLPNEELRAIKGFCERTLDQSLEISSHFDFLLTEPDKSGRGLGLCGPIGLDQLDTSDHRGYAVTRFSLGIGDYIVPGRPPRRSITSDENLVTSINIFVAGARDIFMYMPNEYSKLVCTGSFSKIREWSPNWRDEVVEESECRIVFEEYEFNSNVEKFREEGYAGRFFRDEDEDRLTEISLRYKKSDLHDSLKYLSDFSSNNSVSITIRAEVLMPAEALSSGDEIDANIESYSIHINKKPLAADDERRLKKALESQLQMYRELNDKFMSKCKSDDVERPLPYEALCIIENKFDDFIAYAVERHFNENNYDSMLWKTHNLLEALYDRLDILSLRHKNDVTLNFEGNRRVLWPIHPEDTFAFGSERWGVQNVPNDDKNVGIIGGKDRVVLEYLESPWLHTPYISWAIINAYLLETRYVMMQDFNDFDNRAVFIFFKSELTEMIKYVVKGDASEESKTLDFGGIFKIFLEDVYYKDFKTKIYSKRIKGLKKEIFALLIVVFAVVVVGLSGYTETAAGIFVVYLLMAACFFKWGQKMFYSAVSHIDKIRNQLVPLKEVWSAANNGSISLTYIKDKVATAESFGYRYPNTFHVLLASSKDKFGDYLKKKRYI